MKLGFKGTDNNMQLNKVQFEIGKTYYIDDKGETQELPEGYNVIKSKLELDSSKAISYWNELDEVFNHYSNNGSNRFFKIEILGEFKEDTHKNTTRCIKFLEEIGEKELKEIRKAKESERLDEAMHLSTVKTLQESNPNLIVGGSISLYLQGVRLERFRDGEADYDFILPFYQILKADGLDIESGEDRFSSSDYNESIYIDGVKADVRIDPNQKYELLEYKGFTYKIVPLISIIEAKARYALQKWGSKHVQDIKEMILNK